MIASTAAIAALLVAALAPRGASGHGYMYTPRTRNFVAEQEGANGPTPGVPEAEYCVSCNNFNPEGSYCGLPAGGSGVDYTVWPDSTGTPMPWTSQATYVAGQEIVIEHTYSAHHYGHIEIKACPLGRASSQACLDTPGNALTFVRDDLYGMPADPNYPERGYLKRRSVFDPYKMVFKLPDHVYGEEVLLQWHYITANSCTPDGYSDYFTTNVANGLVDATDWKTNMGPCVLPYRQDGLKPDNDDPEQFWNCAEVSIDPGVPTAPTPPVAPSPTDSPVTRAPVNVEPNPNGMEYPCCAWAGSEFCTQPTNDWCHATAAQCSQCSGTWKDPYGGVPPPPPVAPVAAPPTAPNDIPTTGVPCCSNNFKHCINYACNNCHDSEASCHAAGNFYWLPLGEPLNDDDCIAITYSCVGHNNVCCPGMICNPDSNSQPCIVDNNAPPPAPVPTDAPAPTDAPPTDAPPVGPPPTAPVGPPPTDAPAPTDAPPTAPAPTDAPPVAAPAPTGATNNGIPLPCCGWNDEGCSQPNNDWCQDNSGNCEGACGGDWYGDNTAAPVAAPTTSSGDGCCTWGGWSDCPSWTQGSSDPCQATQAGCSNCSGSWINARRRRNLREKNVTEKKK